MLCEYAFNEKHELVHVDSVPNGLDCNCTCPRCGEKMIAKQGKINEHHFAHSSGSECEGYYETVMHILAKEIIAEEKCVMLPEYKDIYNDFIEIDNYTNYFKLDSKILKFESVEIEQRNDLNDLQPDIVGITGDGLRLWIEIAVTHKCDDNKIQKIKNNNINCIEIQIPENIYSKDDLKNFLVNCNSYRYFINYPHNEKILKEEKEQIIKQKKFQNNCLCKSLYKCNNCQDTKKSFQMVFDNIKKKYYNSIFDWAKNITFDEWYIENKNNYSDKLKLLFTNRTGSAYVITKYRQKDFTHWIYPKNQSETTYQNHATYHYFKELRDFSLFIQQYQYCMYKIGIISFEGKLYNLCCKDEANIMSKFNEFKTQLKEEQDLGIPVYMNFYI